MKTRKIIFGVIFACLMCCMAFSVETEAKQKNTVHYELKKGTLTISGKGEMPNSMVFTKNNKIKKVIVKKGVTSISKYAFEDCKNLKSVKLPSGLKKIGRCAFYNTKIKNVTIPKTVTRIDWAAFYDCKKLKTVTMPGNIKTKIVDADMEIPTFLRKVKTVKFSTNLSIDFLVRIQAENLVVSKNDKKYKSIDGVIYTKNGKKTVRLPARKIVELADGCTTFTMDSFMYNIYLGDDVYLAPARAIEEIVLPKSVTKISVISKRMMDIEVVAEGFLKKIIVKNKEISESEIKNFTAFIPSNYITSETEDNVIEIDREHLYDYY